jgi:hypothetical protein
VYSYTFFLLDLQIMTNDWHARNLEYVPVTATVSDSLDSESTTDTESTTDQHAHFGSLASPDQNRSVCLDHERCCNLKNMLDIYVLAVKLLGAHCLR